MKKSLSLLIILSFFVLPYAQAGAIYRWYDNEGRLHLTQSPPPPNALPAQSNTKGKMSVVAPKWSDNMKKNAQSFMSRAGVKRVWVDRNGNPAPKPKNWY